MLTQTETNRLIKLAQDGDLEARNKVVTENIGLVKKVWQLLLYNKEQRDDLWQEGCVGIIEAVDKYDSEKGASFATYAGFYIYKNMYRFIERNKRSIKLPKNYLYMIKQANKKKERGEELSRYEKNLLYQENKMDISIDGLSDNIIGSVSQVHDYSIDDMMRLAWDMSTRDLSVFFARMSGRTLKDIGKQWGVTRERVRQIEAKVLKVFQDRAKRRKYGS